MKQRNNKDKIMHNYICRVNFKKQNKMQKGVVFIYAWKLMNKLMNKKKHRKYYREYINIS